MENGKNTKKLEAPPAIRETPHHLSIVGRDSISVAGIRSMTGWPTMDTIISPIGLLEP